MTKKKTTTAAPPKPDDDSNNQPKATGLKTNATTANSQKIDLQTHDPTPVLGTIKPSQQNTSAPKKTEPSKSEKTESKQVINDKSKAENGPAPAEASTNESPQTDVNGAENGTPKPPDWQIHKERGNTCYKLGKWAAAVDEYRTAIELNAGQAVLYGNKAMALLKLERYTDVVDECSKALEYDPNFVKAFFRRAQALLKLQKMEQARADLNHVLRLEPKNAEARKEMGILNNMHLHNGVNENITGLSNAVTVVYDDLKGRKLVAAKPIPAGALVLNEHAMSWWISDSSATQLCQMCCSVLPDEPILCAKCQNTAVRFCTASCRDQANEHFHKYECGRPAPLTENDSQKMAILAQRMLTAMKDKPAVKEHCGDQYCADSQFGTEPEDHYGCNMRSVLSLGDKPGVTDVTDYEQAIEQSSVLAELFTKEIPFDKGDDAQDRITNLMHRIIPKVHLNHASLSSPSEDCPDERGIHAFFAVYALTNHSCLPNLFRQNTGLQLQLRTTRAIQEGEELTTTYGPEFTQQMRGERQAILKHHYGFTCDCIACTVPVMEKRERDLHSYHCNQCKKRAYVNNAQHKIICGSCMKAQPFTVERVQALPDMVMQYDKSNKETAEKLMTAIGCTEDQMNSVPCLHSLKMAHACMNYAVYIMGDISEGVDIAEHMVHMAAGLYGEQGAHFTIEYTCATLRVLLMHFQDKYGQLVAELVRKLIKLFVQYFGVENGRKEFVAQLLDVHWFDKYYMESLPMPEIVKSGTDL